MREFATKGMTLKRARYLLFLGMLGLLCGFVTCVAILHAPFRFASVFPFVGCFFGIGISLGSLFFERTRSIWSLVGLVTGSTLSLFTAVVAGFVAMIVLQRMGLSRPGSQGYDHPELLAWTFVGGFVSSALFALSRNVFLSRRHGGHHSLFVRLVLISFAGSILWMAGYVLGPTLGATIGKTISNLNLGNLSIVPNETPSDLGSLFSIFVVSQTLLTPLLFVLFPVLPMQAKDEGRVVHQDWRNSPIWMKVLVITESIILGVLLVPRVRSEREMVHKNTELERSSEQAYTEAPSLENLPRIDPIPTDKVMILHSIHDYVPGLPLINDYSPRDSHPFRPSDAVPRRSYFLAYEVTNPGTLPNRSKAAVSIIQFPNAEWASYQITDHQIQGYSDSGLDAMRKELKFGNKIYVGAPSFLPDNNKRVCYIWPSMSFKVSLCLAEPPDEEFLSEYLTLHPSSLP